MSPRVIKILWESFPKLFEAALKVTMPLTIVSFVLGMVIAMFTALVQTAKIPVLRHLARFYVWIIRGTPLLVQLWIVYFGLPSIGIIIPAFPSATLVLSLSIGAYCSETVRAAIGAVPQGQFEAGYCIGMNYWQIIFRIVLPQALKTAFPPLSNSLISLVKDTSLAYSVAIVEVMATANRIGSRTYDYFWLYVEAAFVYLIFCTGLTWLQGYCEKKLERKKA